MALAPEPVADVMTPDTTPALSIGKAHFIGICGSGMKPVAQAFLAMGIEVSGSDQDLSKGAALREAGARLHEGHAAANLAAADAVVYSTAIPFDNPELRAARERGVPLLHRSEALGWFLRRHTSLLVAGTHGKTTATAFLSIILRAAGASPWSFVGGHVPDFGGNLLLGDGNLAVAEADESDGSFLLLPRQHAILTNIEPEHLDYWKTPEALFAGFHKFVDGLPGDGLLAVCADDKGVRDLLAAIGRPVLRCSLEDPGEDYFAGEIDLTGSGSAYTLFRKGVAVGRVRLGVPGRHNVSNSLACYALADGLGFDIGGALRALEEFRGVDRRFTRYTAPEGYLVIDDYAHHPTEIEATLKAGAVLARERGGRLLAVFQPHRYTRSQRFFAEFAPALSAADEIVVMEVYAAGEEPIEGVDGKSLAAEIGEHGGRPVHFLPNLDDVEKNLPEMLKKDDIVLLLGAGSVTRLANLLAPADA